MKIEITMNQAMMDYLDVKLNLNDGSRRPYRKPSGRVQYINRRSDYWGLILNQIPRAVEEQLNKISSSDEIFDDAKMPCLDALGKAEQKTDMKRKKHRHVRRKKGRKKNITLRNSPLSRSIQTDIVKEFIGLINNWLDSKPSPKSKFNTSTINISYSASPNLASYIPKHNRNLLKEGRAKMRA